MGEIHAFFTPSILFSVIGVGDYPRSLLNTACSKFLENKDMKFGTCKQLWNFMAIEDVTTSIRKIYESSGSIENYDNRVFNIASYDTRVLRSFIEEIYIITKSKSKLFFSHDTQIVDYMDPDIEKFIRLINWKPQISFSQEINKILESKLKNNY